MEGFVDDEQVGEPAEEINRYNSSPHFVRTKRKVKKRKKKKQERVWPESYSSGGAGQSPIPRKN